ncbi:MAG: hypothetical protein RBT34_11370 [Anaerolineaceae bacterium]|jgi:hypothetical protein|nr:hypothetical protein [Anaerolineaceae bacterium]
MQPLVSFQSRHLPDDGEEVFLYTIAVHNHVGQDFQSGAVVCYAMPVLSTPSLLFPAFQAPVAGSPEIEG